MNEHQKEPSQRYAQRSLANSMVEWIHGADGLASAQQATNALFGCGGSSSGVGDSDSSTVSWRVALKDAPSCKVSTNEIVGISIVEFVTGLGLFKSRGEARRMIKSGGLYLNQNRVDNGNRELELNDVLSENLIVLRKGKKNYMLVDVV